MSWVSWVGGAGEGPVILLLCGCRHRWPGPCTPCSSIAHLLCHVAAWGGALGASLRAFQRHDAPDALLLGHGGDHSLRIGVGSRLGGDLQLAKPRAEERCSELHGCGVCGGVKRNQATRGLNQHAVYNELCEYAFHSLNIRCFSTEKLAVKLADHAPCFTTIASSSHPVCATGPHVVVCRRNLYVP